MKWFRKRNRSPLSLSLSHLPPPRHMAGADPDSKWLIIAERCQRARAGANLSPSLSLSIRTSSREKKISLFSPPSGRERGKKRGKGETCMHVYGSALNLEERVVVRAACDAGIMRTPYGVETLLCMRRFWVKQCVEEYSAYIYYVLCGFSLPACCRSRITGSVVKRS